MPDAARSHESPATTATTGNVFGTLLCRVIVPLWVLAGAAFKLYERNPGNLPSGIRDLSKAMNFYDLDTLLRVLIGLEFFAVGVMFLLPRFARAMAIFMLSCFCIILIREIVTGAATCGCFGSLPMKPWQMLALDGTLLLLVIVFPSGGRSAKNLTGSLAGSLAGSLVTAAAIAVVGMGVAIAVPNPQDQQQTPITQPVNESIGGATSQPSPPTTSQPDVPAPPSGGTTTAPGDPPAPPSSAPQVASNLPPTVNPDPKPLPSSWYTEKIENWVGQPWRELEIFRLMPKWPRAMDKGPRYIIFYSRTCDHCRDMLDMELINPLDGLITLVEVPASRTVMTDPAGWAMPMSVEMVLQAELLQLPLGPNWIITTPMIIKVVDGKVECATEGGDHKKCLGL